MQNKLKSILVVTAGLFVLLVSSVAFAQTQYSTAEQLTLDVSKWGATGWLALGAGLCLGLAAFGGALGQGRAASSALDGIARNPGALDKVFTPFIIALALIESLVI
jgi:F-type H+-transporting ATPase subunit c